MNRAPFIKLNGLINGVRFLCKMLNCTNGRAGFEPPAGRRWFLPSYTLRQARCKAPKEHLRIVLFLLSSVRNNIVTADVTSIFVYIVSVKSDYGNSTTEAIEISIVCRIFKPQLQCNIFISRIIHSAEIKGMLIIGIRYFCPVPFYSRKLPAQIVIIPVCHLNRVIAAFVRFV